MKRLQCITLAAAVVVLAPLTGCDVCAGTPSCHNVAQISSTGQFIEHKSGAPVAGVQVAFRRSGGIALDRDTIIAISDADGFFTLRTGSIYDGLVFGDVLVTPPAPYQPYTIAGVTLSTSRIRGDGGNFGRLVVNPYVLLVGHVRDRKTHTPLPDVTVILRRTGGGRLESDSMTFATDGGGQFGWIDPAILAPGPITATFELRAPGYPRAFQVTRDIVPQHRDGSMSFIILPVGSGLSYAATTGRRGSGAQLPGVTVEFKRTGGIPIQPEQVTIPVDAYGGFPIPIEASTDGTVFGDLTIRPPAPFPTEVHPLGLQTSDDDQVTWLGVMGYGAQVYFTASLRAADTGTPLAAGTSVTVKRVAGVPLEGSAQDGDPRGVDQNGKLEYRAATPDSGTVRFDLIVKLPAPFIPDTIRGVDVPARYSDAAWDLGIVQVRRRLAP